LSCFRFVGSLPQPSLVHRGEALATAFVLDRSQSISGARSSRLRATSCSDSSVKSRSPERVVLRGA
jgi:hypothetical protein